MAAARPRRAAADRALAFFQRGFVLQNDDDGLPEDEEDALDEELRSRDEDSSSEEEEQNRGRPQRQRRQRNRNAPNVNEGQNDRVFASYDVPDDTDIGHTTQRFTPNRPPGPQLGRLTRQGVQHFTRAVDFFHLFFTYDIVSTIVEHTNLYAWMKITEASTYGNKQGAWDETTVEEIYKFIALIIYMGFVKVSDLSRYWSTKPLYHGLWARHFMTRDRFKALLGMLHISNPEEDHLHVDDKLRKIRLLLNHVKNICREYYQADVNICIDERMVKSKGRSGIRQFIKDKPTRFGFKLWVMAESRSGFTLDFNVYTGRREHPSENGLAYDVVMMLCDTFQNQGYHLYFDNFYTSPNLLRALLNVGILACGTCIVNRRGLPAQLKNIPWNDAERGDMRYIRDGQLLCLQWSDTKVVTMLSTIHTANGFSMVHRNVKVAGHWQDRMIRKPSVVDAYNTYMGGVDKSDQMLGSYDVLIKSLRWWKTLFFHMVDVSVVNSFLLFQKFQSLHPDVPELHRPVGFSQLNFREELVVQLGGITDETAPPLCTHRATFPTNKAFMSDHIPEYDQENRRNCKVCYITSQKEQKTSWFCTSDVCRVYLCLTKQRNCFQTWHSADFNGRR